MNTIQMYRNYNDNYKHNYCCDTGNRFELSIALIKHYNRRYEKYWSMFILMNRIGS